MNGRTGLPLGSLVLGPQASLFLMWLLWLWETPGVLLFHLFVPTTPECFFEASFPDTEGQPPSNSKTLKRERKRERGAREPWNVCGYRTKAYLNAFNWQLVV